MATKPSNSTCPTVIDAELEDRISWLPGHIVDQILSHLPIRHAVTTSALSKIWRYKWTTIPNLVFDRQCVYAPSRRHDSLIVRHLFTIIIDHVLSLHSGPINKFVIFYQDVMSVTNFERWILYLTRNSIKELELEVWNVQPYELPWCLFSCQSFHCLKLYHCWINPPSAFKGFRNLKVLKLDDVTITRDAFENLISGCPLLEDLKLMYLGGFTQAIIHAPNLKIFEIYNCNGDLESIIFENTFQLTNVSIDLNFYMNFESNQSRLHGCSSHMLNFFSHLPHLQSLEIYSCFLKYLAAGVVPVKLPTSCINLTYLMLHIRYHNLKEISAVLCLVRSSPNLRKIELYEAEEEEEEEEEEEKKKGTALLARVSYCGKDVFSGPTIPLRVRHVRIVDISELVTKLNQFKRASRQVEVIYHGETK
ncbi:unnamed protein product [Vicia faba]|uniref:F-box/FBD/LRR-repeat protein n=1 Tax=Vicia faba TaxID=3906 RepID=A0AAV1A5V8_VICFA|nr:unnamed protein product [Vicia faba]